MSGIIHAMKFNIKQGIPIFLLMIQNSFVTNFKVVSRFETLDEFYGDIRWKQSTEEVLIEQDGEKQIICDNIFNSPYFESKLEVFADAQVSNEIRYKLQKYYKNIYNNLFPLAAQETWIRRRFQYVLKKENNDCKCILPCLPILRTQEPVFSNKYLKKKVKYLNSSSDELVFICLSENLRNHQLKPYFISRGYLATSKASFYAINFLFTYGAQKELKLEAVIESPSHSLRWIPGQDDEQLKGPLKEYYLLQRAAVSEVNIVKGVSSLNHLLCEKKSSFKIRTCASVMHAFRYRTKVKFWPSKFHAGNSCIVREVKLVENGKEYKFQEYLLKCTVRDRNNKKVHYFLSASSGQTMPSLFVFTKGKLGFEVESLELFACPLYEFS